MQSITPPSLPEIIATASKLDDSSYEVLDELLKLPTSTNPSDKSLHKASTEIGLSEKELRYFFSFLSFLYSETADIEAEELYATLNAFVKKHGSVANPERVAGKLQILLSHRDVYQTASKVGRLREGLLPNIIRIANYVDIRNDFERDEHGALTGRLGTPVVIVQLGIQTNSVKDSDQEFILQLDENALDLLQSTLEEIRSKITILKQDVSLQ